ncbi:pyruvate ferredoxin oxidoreductase [Candidatus Aerophobetes bacterium]|uniref:Pyruvate ferredoxin oxidoreductase n=1 Tax=Aerophobetes bacterium TaxID=2030807 RepID=A0A497E577_UNCAE|nr:MAG: pyruvate ferredoxin oxidoreductase [Candidatus Aerophobetes bacterium]
MSRIVGLTGDETAAEAMRQINPDVLAAYPITPQTETVQRFSEFVANGLVSTEMVRVESEHSAMSACVGAAAAGARAMTATSANGLALMWEIVYIAASYRLPIVMAVVNRALSGPINIHCDHSDSMGARDSGWIQLYSENCQEVYDNLIQAVRIGEDKDVLLPVMVTFDGFIISHAMERVEILEDEEVKSFIGEFRNSHSLLDIDHPVTYGPLDLYDYYFEHKRQQIEAMEKAPSVIKKVGREFGKLSGRPYDLLEKYKTEEAELIIVAAGSTAGTVKVAVDELREENVKAGLLKIRAFRPFPYQEIAQVLKEAKAVAVLDRSASFGAQGGPLFLEVRSSLFEKDRRPPVINYIYGLGGRDIKIEQIKRVYEDLEEIAMGRRPTQPVSYLGVRE